MVQLLDVFPHGMGVILVMEYLPLGLSEVIRNFEYKLSESQIKKYMKMLLLGIDFLHSENIMHRVRIVQYNFIE